MVENISGEYTGEPNADSEKVVTDEDIYNAFNRLVTETTEATDRIYLKRAQKIFGLRTGLFPDD
jgi:hypothetical protein